MIKDNRYFWSHLKTENVTVSVRPPQPESALVFRVSNMIDVGRGRQTVILESLWREKGFATVQEAKSSRIVPLKMGTLDFVYTSGQNPYVRNIRSFFSSLYGDARIEKIVPDVLAPGDLVVVRKGEGTSSSGGNSSVIDTYRVVRKSVYKGKHAGYAV